MKSSIGLFYQLTVRDKNGKIVKKTKPKQSKSLTFQFLQILFTMFSSVNVAGGKDVTGAARTIDADQLQPVNNIVVKCADDSDVYGIQIGSGDTAVDNMDYALAIKIDHGLAAGELDYGAHSFTYPTEVGANVDGIISRTFFNGSGNSIDVKELGLVAHSKYDPNTAGYFLITRDVIATVAVGNAQTLTVTYTFRTTV